MKRALIAAVGAYVCVMGAVVHRHTVDVGRVDVPWGLILVLAVTAVVVVAAERWLSLGAAWFGLGWAIALTAQQFAPGGGYLVASDWLGWSFTAGSLGVVVVGVVLAPRLGR